MVVVQLDQRRLLDDNLRPSGFDCGSCQRKLAKAPRAKPTAPKPAPKPAPAEPVKLTDEVLYMVDQALAEWGTWAPDLKTRIEGEDVAAAIRALRDRAKAVVESEHDDYGVGWSVNHIVDDDALRALEEVLP